MQKKKNNPWYYYLSGNLVKKRKPAMPGDAVLIKQLQIVAPYEYAINYSSVVVYEVFMGGFHDRYRNYYPWSELKDPNEIDVEFDNLHKEIDFAWEQVEEAHKEVEKMKKQIKDLQEINGWLLSNYSTTSKK